MTADSTNSRSADASIRGYIYQFDRTIHQILTSDPADSVTVEGIEDVDVFTARGTTAEQCKYLPASKFSLATIRDAITAMLDYYAAGHEIEFSLYIHVSADSTDFKDMLTPQDLRECLTVRKRKPVVAIHRLYEKYDPETLDEFSAKLRIVRGSSLEDQRNEVIAALSAQFKCTDEVARIFFYPAALNAVAKLATQSRSDSRTTDRASFTANINSRRYLYTIWHEEMVGRLTFVNHLARDLKRSFRLNHDRVRYLGLSISEREDVEPAATLVRTLATVFYGPGKLHTAKPWTVIVDCASSILLELKRELARTSIVFNDGFEAFEFNTSLFLREPIIVRRGRSKLIARTSFEVRLLSLASFESNYDHLPKPDAFLLHRSFRLKLSQPVPETSTVELGALTVADLQAVMERCS